MQGWPVFFAMLLLGAPALADQAASPPLRIYEEEFHLRADRRFGLTSWRELEATAGDLAAAAGCRALGVDCSDGADGPKAAGRYLKRPIASDAYRGTARLLRLRGGSYYAKFVAPPGYTICRAGLYRRAGILAGDAVFAGSIARSSVDGLAVYADLGSSSRGVAEFRLLVLYAARSGSLRGCWPDQTILFLCREGACRTSRSYPETDLR